MIRYILKTKFNSIKQLKYLFALLTEKKNKVLGQIEINCVMFFKP